MIGVGLERFPASGVISPEIAIADLVCVGNQAAGRVAEAFDPGVWIAASSNATEQIEGVRDGDAVGVGDIDRPVFVVIDDLALGSKGV